MFLDFVQEVKNTIENKNKKNLCKTYMLLKIFIIAETIVYNKLFHTFLYEKKNKLKRLTINSKKNETKHFKRCMIN